jgi:hypothetical protein
MGLVDGPPALASLLYALDQLREALPLVPPERGPPARSPRPPGDESR